MLNKINFNHLYYFYIIASEGSIAAATKKLNVSQPTLSQQLKQFEDQLGQTLFNRSGRSLQINEHGEYILEYAVKIFDYAETMLSGFSYRQKISQREIYNIGITSSVSRSYATRLLKPLFTSDDLGLSVEEGGLEYLIKKLHLHELDFILSETPNEYMMTKAIEVVNIRKPEYLFVCGRNFSKRIINFPEDFSDMPYFKYPSSNSIQREIDKFFFKNKVLPKVVGQSDDLNIMLSATEVNNCFSVVPDIAVDSLIKEKRIFEVGKFKYSNTQICAIHLKEISNENIKSLVIEIKNQF